MPAIRDGRGQLVVEPTLPPAAVPPGPVERSRVSEARMADFAAERANGGEHIRRDSAVLRESGERGRAATESHWARKRAEKAARFIAAVRETANYAEAAETLGTSRHGVEQFMSDLRKRGELPADVDELLIARGGRPASMPGSGRRKATVLAVLPDKPTIVAADLPDVPATPDVVMPCDRCAHALVCSIKATAAIKGWPHSWWSTPDVALHVAEVRVRCDHFLEARAR